jgi:hypothetical protein
MMTCRFTSVKIAKNPFQAEKIKKQKAASCRIKFYSLFTGLY